MGRGMTLRVDRLLRASILVLVAILLLVAIPADGALVRTGRIVVEADGGYAPTVLPRKKFAPIRFNGWAEIRTTDGAPPPALSSVVLDFDSAGRLDTKGLPVCTPAEVEALDESGPAGLRRCHRRHRHGLGDPHHPRQRRRHAALAADDLQRPPDRRPADRRRARLHSGSAAPRLRGHGPDPAAQGGLRLPRQHRDPGLRRRSGGPHPHERQDRPRIPGRRPAAQLRLGPLRTRRLRDPRPLHVRRGHRGRRQRLPRLPGPTLGPPDLPILGSLGPLAQLVEQETLNLKVVGSIPTRPIPASPLRGRAASPTSPRPGGCRGAARGCGRWRRSRTRSCPARSAARPSPAGTRAAPPRPGPGGRRARAAARGLRDRVALARDQGLDPVQRVALAEQLELERAGGAGGGAGDVRLAFGHRPVEEQGDLGIRIGLAGLAGPERGRDEQPGGIHPLDGHRPGRRASPVADGDEGRGGGMRGAFAPCSFDPGRELGQGVGDPLAQGAPPERPPSGFLSASLPWPSLAFFSWLTCFSQALVRLRYWAICFSTCFASVLKPAAAWARFAVLSPAANSRL